MTYYIDENSAKNYINFPTLIAALERQFSNWEEPPLRTILPIPSAPGVTNIDNTMLIMPAWDSADYIGIKTVSIFPENYKKDLPGLHSIYNLFDKKTGVPLTTIAANPITVMRTAAISALAAKYLARKDAKRLLIVGAGAVASVLPEAFSTVCDIEEVLIWNRSFERGNDLVNNLKAQNYNAKLVLDLEQSVKTSDIVSCATLSNKPIIYGKWLQPGTHLDLIGSFSPQMRETDAACFKDSSLFIDTQEAVIKSGDLIEGIRAGTIRESKIKATLSQICSGQRKARVRNDEITVFKAVGNAMEDLVAAKLIYESMLNATN